MAVRTVKKVYTLLKKQMREMTSFFINNQNRNCAKLVAK